MTNERGTTQHDGERTSPWEWVTAALGALLVLGVVGYLVYGAVREPARALPALTVQVDTVATHGAGYVVEFRVRNSATATAAAVVIEGTLETDTGTVETSSTTIDYVPAEAARTGGLFFTKDPRRYRLALRPLGYDRP